MWLPLFLSVYSILKYSALDSLFKIFSFPSSNYKNIRLFKTNTFLVSTLFYFNNCFEKAECLTESLKKSQKANLKNIYFLISTFLVSGFMTEKEI